MSGEDKINKFEKTIESTGSKDSKKPETSKTSTTSFSFISTRMGLNNFRFVVPVLARDEDEIQDDEGMKRFFRQMCIHPRRQFDPKISQFRELA